MPLRCLRIIPKGVASNPMGTPGRAVHDMSTPVTVSPRDSHVAPRRRRVLFAVAGAALAVGGAFAVAGVHAPPVELEDEALAAGPDAGTLSFVSAARKGTIQPPVID